MTDVAPISYANAELVCRSAAIALRTAGPAACSLPPTSYVPLVGDLEKVGDLLGIIETKRAAREAKERAP